MTPVDRDHDDWTLVARAVEQRRKALELTRQAAAAATATGGKKISLEAWRKVEKAVEPPYSRTTTTAICRVLGWRPDAFDAILRGEKPVEVEPVRPEDDIHRLLATIEERLGISAPSAGSADERLEDILDEIDRNLGLGRNTDGDGAGRGHSKGAPSY